MKRNLLALALLVPGAVVAQNVTPPERTVVVSATGTVERDPERALLLLAVESTGATAQQATQANATRMDALIAEIRRRGISAAQVRTVSYQLTPEYARSPQPPVPERQGPPRIIGYRAANMVQVTIDSVARVGGVIDAAIQAGANRVAGLRFELRDPQSARLEALRLAVLRARGEAEAMASAAGQRLGPPLNINTHGEVEPRGFEMAGVRMDVAQAPPTPIEPGTLTITASVTITFRLDPS
ncbi:MAG: SIMPL domain-containing protein [Longimicrobiales bacterium]